MVGKKTPYDIATCSSLPAIKGISSWTSRNEQLDSAIKARNGELPEYTIQTVTQRMGDVLEPVLCEEARSMLGLDSVKVDHEEPVTHPYLPLMGSLDATAVANKLFFKNGQHDWLIIPEQESITLDGPGVIECKCTRNTPTNDLEEWRGVLQAKGLMECTGYGWAAVIVLCQSTDFRINLYSRDPNFKDELSSIILDFDNRVKTQTYYPPTTTNDANIVYKNVKKDIISLDHEADKLCDLIQTNKSIIKDMQQTIEDAEVRLKELIQDSEIGQTNRYMIKWPMINYKAQEQKIIPAKEARSVRAKTLRIKQYGEKNESSVD